MSPWIDALLRWVHVLAGILWIGHLYCSAVVEGRVAGSTIADPRNALLAETRDRLLRWVRWGAVSTWVTGVSLTAVVYYSTLDNLVRREVRFAFKYGLTTEFMLATNEPVVTHGAGILISVALLALGFLAYEAVWRLLARSEGAAAATSLGLLALTLFLLGRVFTGRAVFLHAGALLGTVMALNVWTRIRPAHRRILEALRGLAPAPDPAVPALAAQRARHNVYLSVPVVFAMISNHYPAIHDRPHAWAIVVGVVVAGWAVARWLFDRSGGAAPDRSGAGQPSAPDARAPPADAEA